MKKQLILNNLNFCIGHREFHNPTWVYNKWLFFLHYSTLKLMSDKFLLWLTKLYFRFIHPCATSSASKKKSDNFFNENMIYCNQLSKTIYWWITLFHHDISIFYRWWCLLTFNSTCSVRQKNLALLSHIGQPNLTLVIMQEK